MAQYGLPASDVANTWNTGGYTAIDEGFGAGRGSGSGPSDADYMQEDIGGGGVWDGTVSSLSAPVSGTHTLRMRGAKDSASGETGHATLQLYQGNPGSGGTLIATLTGTTYTGTTFTTDTYNLTAGEVSSITNYATLYFRLTEVKDGGGAGRNIRISAVELEIPDAPTPKSGTDSGSGSDASASVVYDITGTDSGGLPASSGSVLRAVSFGSSVTSLSSTPVWTNPDNIDSDDSNYASSTINAFDTTEWLYGYGLTQSVPAGVTITGFVVEVNDFSSTRSNDLNVYLTKDGSNGSPSQISLPAGTGWQSVGSSTSMFGYSEVTVAEANSSTFGFFGRITNLNDTLTDFSQLDAVRITIYYEGSAGTAEQAVTSTDTGAKSGTDSATGTEGTSTLTASITATETGSGADSSALAASVTATTDTGSGADASTLAAAYALTDTGSASDSASVGTASLTATETGSGADASALAASITATADTGSGADSGVASILFSRTDSGTGTDSATVGAASLTATDTGAGSEASSLVASATATDTGSGADASALAVALAVTDTGSLSAESGRVSAPVATTDTGSGSDSSALAAAYALTDTGTGTDTATVGVASLTATDSGALSGEVAVTSGGATLKAGTDSGSGSEVSALAASITATTDTSSGADASSLAAVYAVVDSSTGVDVGAATISAFGTDSGTGSDAASPPVASITATDTGAGTESGLVDPAVLATTETGSGAEASSLSAVLGATDSGSATESSSATTAGGPSGTDSGSGVDSVSALTVGFDDGVHASFPTGSWTPMDWNAGEATDASVATTSNSNWYGGPYWVDQGGGAYAASGVDVSSFSEDLRLLDWGFAATQPPRHVVVEFDWTQQEGASVLGIQLTKNGGSSAFKSASVGGPNDLGYPTRAVFDVFGSLSAAQLNSANFGVLFYGDTGAAADDFTVSNIKVSVVYETETATVHVPISAYDGTAQVGQADDFNRADEDLTTPWVKGTGSTGTFSVSSNQITRTTSDDSYYYYDGAIVDEPDQWAEATFVGGSEDAGPAVRIGGDGTANLSCYLYIGFGYISKFNNGSWSSLKSVQGISAGQTARLEVRGSTVSLFIDGKFIDSVTDTSVPNAAQGPGMFIYQAGSTWDDWAGGALNSVESATPDAQLPSSDTGSGSDATGTRGFIVDDLGTGSESLGSRTLAGALVAFGVDTADAAWNLASLPDSSLALTAEGGGTLALAAQGEGSVALSVAVDILQFLGYMPDTALYSAPYPFPSSTSYPGGEVGALSLSPEDEASSLTNTPIDWEPQ